MSESDTRIHPRVEDITHVSEDCLSIFLPFTKTHQNRGETTYLFRQEDELDPITALNHHISFSRLLPLQLIASFRRPDGSIVHMSKDIFMKRCNQIWKAEGIERMTGHSFRIGGATVFLQHGVESDIVKRLGRWKSDAAMLYWRNLPRVLGQHAIRITLSNKRANQGHHKGADGCREEEEVTEPQQRIICRISKEKIDRIRPRPQTGGHRARLGGGFCPRDPGPPI
jgi:hypothetical protein